MSVLDDPRVLRKADDWFEVDARWTVRFVPETREWHVTPKGALFVAPPWTEGFGTFADLDAALDRALVGLAGFFDGSAAT